MDTRQTVTVLEQIRHALERAHRAGFVHRDLKPDNIWLSSEREIFAKVPDFGVVKSSLGTSSGGTPFGTLIRGSVQRARSDGEDHDGASSGWSERRSHGRERAHKGNVAGGGGCSQGGSGSHASDTGDRLSRDRLRLGGGWIVSALRRDSKPTVAPKPPRRRTRPAIKAPRSRAAPRQDEDLKRRLGF